MISRRHRLSKEQFNTVFENGVVLRSKHFLVRRRADAPDVRYAVVVGKKVAARATARNTLRRRVFACLSNRTRVSTGVRGWYIFFVRVSTLPNVELLCEELSEFFTTDVKGGAQNKARIQ